MPSAAIAGLKRDAEEYSENRDSKRQKGLHASPMATWFNDPKYSDLTIESNGEEFKVHRVVLASSCRFFEMCCGSEFSEATSRVIKMDVDDADALRHLLRYIYTANIDELVAEADHKDNYDFLDHLLDVFLLADKYDLPTLSELLVEAFQDVKVYWEASQAVRAYVRIIQLPKGITARRQLTDAAIAKVTGPDLRWNDLNPAERNAAREEPDSAEPGPGEESIASAVTAVAENPEAALYIMSQLGSMLNLAQATMLDRYYASAIVPLSQADTTSEPDDDNMTTDESDSDDDDEAGFTADNDPALNIEMIFEEDEIDTDAEDADYVESDSDDEEVLDVVVIE